MSSEVVAGRYTLVRELGRGASATVFLAHDVTLDRDVALKIVAPALANDPSFIDRFMREAQLAARLSHPNIVTVHDVGETADQRPFIAMSLVNGTNLEDVIARSAPLAPAEASRILNELAGALDYLHGQGLIHRDVKPSNVLIEESGRVMLSDFGVAYARESARYTMTGIALGTPRYMAPEQMLGEEPTAQTDVYAMGVLAFELLAGAPPFEGTGTGLMYKIVHEPPPPVSRLAPSVPPGIDSAIDRALQKDPAARWASPGEFAAAIASPDSNATALGVLARPAPPPAPPAEARAAPEASEAAPKPEHELVPAAEGSGSGSSKKKALIGAGGAAVLALAVGSFCLAAGGTTSPGADNDDETPTAAASSAVAAAASSVATGTGSPPASATASALATQTPPAASATSTGSGGGPPPPTSPPGATATPSSTSPSTATVNPAPSPTTTSTPTRAPTPTLTPMPTLAPPNAPSNVTGTGTTLSWNDNSHNESGFRIYWRATNLNNGEVVVQNDKTVSADTLTTSVAQVILIAIYKDFGRGVSAYNSAGESPIAWE